MLSDGIKTLATLEKTFLLKPWLMAARLKTLPLASANIILGTLLAYFENSWSIAVFILGLFTALLLQILSNFANDYGDYVSGADQNRNSTYKRALQTGQITKTQMRFALIALSALTIMLGIALIVVGGRDLGLQGMLFFLIAGILCIVAAITYTVGKKPYGYMGLGDISVFLFFGVVGVCGIYLLHTHVWNWLVLLPAASMGLFSAGVLNINNIRDIESDRSSGKNTLVVRLGLTKARIYHTVLILFAFGLSMVYTALCYHGFWQLLYLVTLPFFIRNIINVRKGGFPALFDKELKNLALTTFCYAVTFGLGNVL